MRAMNLGYFLTIGDLQLEPFVAIVAISRAAGAIRPSHLLDARFS